MIGRRLLFLPQEGARWSLGPGFSSLLPNHRRGSERVFCYSCFRLDFDHSESPALVWIRRYARLYAVVGVMKLLSLQSSWWNWKYEIDIWMVLTRWIDAFQLWMARYFLDKPSTVSEIKTIAFIENQTTRLLNGLQFVYMVYNTLTITSALLVPQKINALYIASKKR